MHLRNPAEAPGRAAGTDRSDGAGRRPLASRARWRLAAAGRLPGRVTARIPRRLRLPLLTYAVCQVILACWWAAYYPALLTRDSVTYVIYVTTGPWVDHHSVPYESLVWLSLHATGGLAALAVAQTAAMSATLAYTVAAFRRLRVPGRWTAVAAVVVAALPPLGTFTVFIWKDVPFVIASMLVVPTLAHLAAVRREGGQRAGRRAGWLVTALGLELLGVCLFRLNGFMVVAGAAVALVILLPGLRGRLAAVAGAAIVLTFALNLYVYPAAGIQPTPRSLSFATVYSDLAVAYSEAPGTFTAADKRLMARVVPLSEWAKTADCYDSDSTSYLPGFAIRSDPLADRLFSLWLRVLGRRPNLILGARLCRGSIAWSIFPGRSLRDGYTIVMRPPTNFGVHDASRVPHNPYRAALRLRPLSWTAYSVASFLWRVTLTRQLDWLLWRGAFWCYLSYLMVYLFARARRNWRLLSLGAIVAAQQLAITADINAQSFRYMASPVFIGIMLVPLALARRRAAGGPEAAMATERAPAGREGTQ